VGDLLRRPRADSRGRGHDQGAHPEGRQLSADGGAIHPDTTETTHQRDDRLERASELRLAAIGATAFVVSYAAHRLLQGAGPGSADPAAVSEWIEARRGLLLVSEIALGAALLASFVFLAPLVVVVREAGATVTAAAVSLSGAVFIATGFLALAAETTLFAIENPEPGIVAVLSGLQSHTPNVLAAAALAACLSPAFWRRHLAWRWMGIASFVAAVVFTFGFVVGVVVAARDSSGSSYGSWVFVVWMALVAAALWVSSARRLDEK
jgi:hypothetical protein